MSTNIARIGAWNIEITPGHIYNDSTLLPTYDYVPWNLIGDVLRENGLLSSTLLDVGANVGDSLAHFRRLSPAPVICVEASPYFFSILERNAAQFSAVSLVNKLLMPTSLAGRVKFASGDQTGCSSIAAEGEETWTGPSVSLEEVTLGHNGKFIFKTDTDGFDGTLVQYMCRVIEERDLDVPLIFFEGPSEEQQKSGDFETYSICFENLIRLGYKLLFLTNYGIPYAYADGSYDSAMSACNALKMGYQHGQAACHYFDVIALREEYITPTFRLATPWGENLFRRS